MKYIDLKLEGGASKMDPGGQDVNVILTVKLYPSVNYEGLSGLLHPPLSAPGNYMRVSCCN